jgi:hypothetical protein
MEGSVAKLNMTKNVWMIRSKNTHTNMKSYDNDGNDDMITLFYRL